MTTATTPERLPARRPIRGLDPVDGAILNVMQEQFPVVARPYLLLADATGTSEEDAVRRVARMKDMGVLRQVSAIWDTRALGYKTMLVAMRAAPERIDAAARVINAHPGVSHNYKRNHEFNIWFTLAVPANGDLEWCVQRLGKLAGAESIRMLPTLRLFKIGVTLDMTGERSLTHQSTPDYSDAMRAAASNVALTPFDVDLVRATQEDLPVVERPFLPAAQTLGITEDALFEELARLRRQGHLRRFAAILRHRRAGFGANGMAVWEVPEERLPEVGPLMASFKVVSHCYQRPTYEDWPYNVFTMVHARTVEDCQAVVDAIRESSDVDRYAILYSTKEYRKIRLRYFTPDLDEWEARQRSLEAAGR